MTTKMAREAGSAVRRIAVSLLAVVLTCTGIPAIASPNDQAPAARDPGGIERMAGAIDGFVAGKMEEEHLPGVAVVVVRDGATIFKRGYGFADLEARTPVEPDNTIFRIGSITKVLTALVATRLADRGKLRLSDDIDRYLDDVPVVGTFDDPVTLWHLITHTGGFDQIGIGRQVRPLDLPLGERKARRPGLAAFLADRNLRRVTEPGVMFRYDTYGITLAGLIIERVTGTTYAEAMTREMFEPLGMTRSSVETAERHASDLAVGYGFSDDRFHAQPYEVYVTTPASSVDATAADMGRLLEALTGDGATEHGRFLSPEANARATAPQFAPHEGFVGISHGLRETGWPVHAFEHGGSMLGFTSKLVVIPEQKLGYFVTTNRDEEAGGGPVHLADEMIFPILESLLEPAPPKPFDVPSRPVENDVSRFVGRYGSGVYCHTCTPQELEQGAWRPAPGSEVVEDGPGAIRFLGKRYIAMGNDLFVRDDGRRLMYFGTDASGAVLFTVLSDSPETLERRN